MPFAGDIPEGETVVGAGVVSNPCEIDLEYMATSGCLVGSVVWDGPEAGMDAPMCTSAIEFVTVPAGESVSESYTLGALPEGDYTLTVNFNVAVPAAETDFTVVAPAAEPVPDFSLTDDNPESPTFGDTVSPRDLMGQVTGWYFIKAT
jgi:hypothetical protein